MDSQSLEQIGLNPTQVKGYIALVQRGSLTPPEMAKEISITRTNAYELLSQLEKLGLAAKVEGQKVAYRPGHPAALEKLIKARRDRVLEQENKLHAMMPQLLTYFYSYSEQPGVRFFQGRDGIIDIYKDILRTKKPVYLVRTPAEHVFLGDSFMTDYINQRVKAEISVTALTPRHPSANTDPETDQKMLMERTWVELGDYAAPVEVDIYGSKVALISFGEEVMGMIIESPQIAEAMKQLFVLMRRGAQALESDVAPENSEESEPAGNSLGLEPSE